MKLAVFTLKADAAFDQTTDEELLEALMSLFEAAGGEVTGELTYEDIEDKDDVQKI